jgi:hypothetical protein
LVLFRFCIGQPSVAIGYPHRLAQGGVRGEIQFADLG